MKILWLVSSALLLAGCGGGSGKPVTAAAPEAERRDDGVVAIAPGSPGLREIRVETVKAEAVPFDVVTSPGKIEANPNLMSRVVLPLPGRVVTVLVKIGDSVRRGQPLLTLESPDADAAESAYLQSEAALTQARANLNKAQADLDRLTDLFEHEAVAKKDVLTAENALAQARASVDQASAGREQSIRRLQLLGLKPGQFGQPVTVNAPISGKVLEMSVAAGEYRNDTNAALMAIADLSAVWVSSDVPESAIRFIKRGERIDVELAAYPNETFRARVTRIADVVDPQTRTIKVRAEMSNAAERFRPEMFATIRHTEETRLTPVVPAGSVAQGDGKNVVFVERGPGRFQPVEVKLGPRTGDSMPVLAGLRAGERVVVDGVMLLKGQ
jgi:membrane fusion protein, heavy metal efflux system